MRIRVEFHDLDKSLKNFVLEGVCSQITYSLITVTIISSYLATTKIPPFLLSVLISIPHTTTVAQIISAKFVEKRNRKKISIYVSLIAKITLIGIAVNSFFGGDYEVLFFAILYLIFNICEDVYTVTWSSWSRDLISGGKRGEIFSKRSAYGRIFAIFAILPQIFVFDRMDKTGFSVLFLTSALIGLIGVYFLRNVENVRSSRISEIRLIEPMRNINFLKLIFSVSIFLFAISSARTFFTVFLINCLQYSLSTVLFLAFLAHLSSIYSFRISGIFSDNLGNKPLFTLSFLTFSISAILFAFSTQKSFWILAIAYILHGFYTSAPTIALTNAIADLTYKKYSAPYYALSNWLQDTFSAIGCVFAGILVSSLYESGDIAFRVLFIFSAILSLLSFFTIRLYDEYAPSQWNAMLKMPKLIIQDIARIFRIG